MRSFALCIAVVLGALLCCICPAGVTADPSPSSNLSILTPDPYLTAGDVTAAVPMAVRCPCSIFTGCSYKPIGYDCAEPAGCCHCSGVDPALRMCVYNAR